MRAFAPGIYPRSEALVQATRGPRAGPVPLRKRRRARASATSRSWSRCSGLPALAFLSDGMPRSQDLFRPARGRSPRVSTPRPLTRFLDTNTFYRAVLVGGEPHLATPLPAPDLPAGEWVGTLPSPLAFARAARDEVSAQKLAANVLAPQIAAWAGAGAAMIVLSDPRSSRARAGRVSSSPPSASSPRASRFRSSSPSATRRPYSPALRRRRSLRSASTSIATSLYALPEGYSKEILAGVLDARSLRCSRSPRRDRPLRRRAAGPRAGRARARSERRPAVRSGAHCAPEARAARAGGAPARGGRVRRPLCHP